MQSSNKKSLVKAPCKRIKWEGRNNRKITIWVLQTDNSDVLQNELRAVVARYGKRKGCFIDWQRVTPEEIRLWKPLQRQTIVLIRAEAIQKLPIQDKRIIYADGTSGVLRRVISTRPTFRVFVRPRPVPLIRSPRVVD